MLLTGETYTFRRYALASYRIIYQLITFSGSLLAILVLIRIHWDMKLGIALTFIVSFVLINWGLFTKISISPEGVRSKSLLGSRFISWGDVKNTGVLLKKRYSLDLLKPEQYEKKAFPFEKNIWLSTDRNFVPQLYSFSSSSYMNFHYNKKAWDLLLQYLGEWHSRKMSH